MKQARSVTTTTTITDRTTRDSILAKHERNPTRTLKLNWKANHPSVCNFRERHCGMWIICICVCECVCITGTIRAPNRSKPTRSYTYHSLPCLTTMHISLAHDIAPHTCMRCADKDLPPTSNPIGDFISINLTLPYVP